jgi:hypothetical protein
MLDDKDKKEPKSQYKDDNSTTIEIEETYTGDGNDD